MNNVLLIGIAGGTGSGKTTITKRLRSVFDGNVSVVYHDSYYKAHHYMTYEERSALNYDSPDAFDTDMLIEAVKELKAGRDVVCPIYDYTIHDRVAETVAVKAAPVVIVEGILILENKELCNLLDIKIFVDTDADVRILRRLKRDVRDRGRTIESITNQYLTTVKPMHEMYVEPSKKNADIIVPEGGKNQVALDMITAMVAEHLSKHHGD